MELGWIYEKRSLKNPVGHVSYAGSVLQLGVMF